MKKEIQTHRPSYLINGGTEGFRGENLVIIPYKTSCFVCDKRVIDDNRKVYPSCTIASNPRTPEHCIIYASEIEWQNHHDKNVDKDSIEDVEWIYKIALERAKEYNIEGVTYNMTLGVIKNIIPAIASTNALIAVSTVVEALKIWAGFSKRLDNFFNYHGPEGIYSFVERCDKNEKCEICSKHVEIIKVEESEIWKNVFAKITQITKMTSNQEFSIFHNLKYFYKAVKENGDIKILSEIDENKTIKELVDSGAIEIKKLFEIIPEDDKNNSIKVKLKRPQDYEEEE